MQKVKVPSFSDKIKHYENTMSFHEMNIWKIWDIITGIKNGKSSGYDNISVRTLKRNKRRNIGKIKSIFRNNDQTQLMNYRQITLISNIRKIAEIIKLRVTKLRDQYEIISHSLFGFKFEKSTDNGCCHLYGISRIIRPDHIHPV